MNDKIHDSTVHFAGFKQHPLEHVGMKKKSSLEFDSKLEDEPGQRNHFIHPPAKSLHGTYGTPTLVELKSSEQ